MKQIFLYALCVHVHSMKQGWDDNEHCVCVASRCVCARALACVLVIF